MKYKDELAKLFGISGFVSRRFHEDWLTFERVHRLNLPASYKELSDCLWNARLFGDFRFLHPTDPHSNPLLRTESLEGIFSMENSHPVPLFPDEQGFVNVVDTGSSIFVLVRRGNAVIPSWAVVDAYDQPICFEQTMEPWEFFYKLMTQHFDHPAARSFYESGVALGLPDLVTFES